MASREDGVITTTTDSDVRTKLAEEEDGYEAPSHIQLLMGDPPILRVWRPVKNWLMHEMRQLALFHYQQGHTLEPQRVSYELGIGKVKFRPCPVDLTPDGIRAYTNPSIGVLDVREAFLTHLDETCSNSDITGIEPDMIKVVPGGQGGIEEVVELLFESNRLNQDDEVAVIAPFWVNLQTELEMHGVRVRFIQTKAEDNFQLTKDREALKMQLTGCKALFAMTPGNPTGVILSWQDLDNIAWVMAQPGFEDLWFVCDHEYHGLTKVELPLALHFPSWRVIGVFSVSKNLNLTSWRIGYIVTRSKKLAAAMLKNGDRRLSACNGAGVQEGIAKAYLDGTATTFYLELMKYIEEGRRAMDAGANHYRHLFRVQHGEAYYASLIHWPGFSMTDFVHWSLKRRILMVRSELMPPPLTWMMPHSGFRGESHVARATTALGKIMRPAIEQHGDDLVMYRDEGEPKYGLTPVESNSQLMSLAQLPSITS